MLNMRSDSVVQFSGKRIGETYLRVPRIEENICFDVARSDSGTRRCVS